VEQLIAWLGRFFGSWKPWIIVSPWNIAVAVRLGKSARALHPGPHFRIPGIDQITLVNTRLRVATTPPSTMKDERPGYSRVRRAIVGYLIHDPLAAIAAYNNPEAAVP